jgi:Spy/CpxP family protein refolding chaperone
MLGKEFKGEPLVASRPTGFPTPLPTISLLVRVLNANKAAAEETLKLTPEQAKKLNAAWDEYQKALQAIPQTTGPGQAAERNRALAGIRETFDKAVAGLLTAEQEKRLAQIGVQLSAASNLGTLLTSADTVKALELTAEQTKKITALGEDAVKFHTLMATESISDPELKLGYRLRDIADNRMLAVLTAAQKAKWKEMIGDEFPGLRKTLPSRFGPGGPGGGFGGPGGIGGTGGFPGGGFGGPIEP